MISPENKKSKRPTLSESNSLIEKIAKRDYEIEKMEEKIVQYERAIKEMTESKDFIFNREKELKESKKIIKQKDIELKDADDIIKQQGKVIFELLEKTNIKRMLTNRGYNISENLTKRNPVIVKILYDIEVVLSQTRKFVSKKSN